MKDYFRLSSANLKAKLIEKSIDEQLKIIFSRFNFWIKSCSCEPNYLDYLYSIGLIRTVSRNLHAFYELSP